MLIADLLPSPRLALRVATFLLMGLPAVAFADGVAGGGDLEDAAARSWRSHATENFELSAVGTAAEVREMSSALETQLTELRKDWSITAASGGWSPRCKVVVHAARPAYLAAAGPGAERTNGSSLVHFDRGRVVGRRIDLDGQRLDWQAETVPHELTHVLLADEFPHGRLPRWADEGAAMLADSKQKRARHRRDALLAGEQGRAFSVAQLLAVDRPLPASRMAAFYGQSLILVEDLVARGDRRRFLDFLHAADHHGYDSSL